MELTGTMDSVYYDAFSGQMKIVLSVNEKGSVSAEYDSLKTEKLSIKIGKYRNRRSLDANAYFHVLVGKLAGAMHISNAYCKNLLIARYGQPMLLPDGSIMVYKTNAPVEYMRELETLHTYPVKSDGTATFYRVYRGSHEYDSAEMARLIDGTVSEAKEAGIETLTPAELAKMEAEWKARTI